MYSKEIKECNLPWPSRRLLSPERIGRLSKVLKRKGAKLVFLGRLAAFSFLGRLAAFPSSAVGATAGSTGMKSRQFLPADGLGALASIFEVMTIGYLLGGFFNPKDPVLSWTVTGLGVTAAFALMFLPGRHLKRE